MPTLRAAIEMFRTAAADGTIINRVTGQPGPFAASRIPPILTHITAAVRRAARPLHGDRDLVEQELLDVELEPLWMVLPHHAKQDAIENDRTDPRKEVANVRLFVSVVTGRDIDAKRRVTPERVTPPWRPLYDSLGHPTTQISAIAASQYRRGLMKMAELSLAHGIASPDALPHDREQIYRMGASLGWSRRNVAFAIASFRAAAKSAGSTSHPKLYASTSMSSTSAEESLGVGGVNDYSQQLREAGYTGDPREISTRDAIGLFAPDLGAALEDTITAGRQAGRSIPWVNARVNAANWVVGTLLRGPVPDIGAKQVRKLTWLDLWVERREVGRASESNVLRLDQTARYRVATGPQDATQEASQDGSISGVRETQALMRIILDASAARSYANSPLRLANPQQECDDVPVYTDKISRNVELAWMITKDFFGDTIQSVNPALWAQARNSYESILRHIATYNGARSLVGRKRKSELPVAWPQMVCMGLPYLARRCYALRATMHDRLGRVGHLESQKGRAMLMKYDRALLDYITIALMTDDGLRIKQYANAMAGANIVVTFDATAAGEVRGIQKIETRWSGYDHETVNLKVRERHGRANERRRIVTPAIVDHSLFYDYWTGARPRALVRAGLLESVDAFDHRNDDWAALVCMRTKAHQVSEHRVQRPLYDAAVARYKAGDTALRPTPLAWRGNYQVSSLTEVFGRAMHEVCTKLLHRELPAYDDPGLAAQWRGIFSGHITRTQIASYIGGIRGQWPLAEFLTNDTEKTLRTTYSLLQQSFDEHRTRRDWECPTWFDAVIDRAMARHPGDDWRAFWRQFNPMQPHEALQCMVEAAERAPSRNAKQRRRDP